MRLPVRSLPVGVSVILLAAALAGCADPGTAAGNRPAGAVSAPARASEPEPVAVPPPPAGGLPAPVQGTPPAGDGAAGPGAAATPAPEPGLHADPGAVDVVVNKRRILTPVDFAPPDLRRPGVATATDAVLLHPDTAAAVEEMFAAAAAEGVGLVLLSGYRSYADQESTYASWVGEYGDAAAADTVSARPGHSEHQTGLAFDVGQADGACTLLLCFRDTPAARWTAEHAAEFGFILRYPLGFHGITGFSAESWHFRYVGRDVSLAMRAAGTQTLEEHFGLPAAPSY